ncbi:MAG: family transposase [Polaromonas sp.]|nr:family transposase [Polaromonas sp.]
MTNSRTVVQGQDIVAEELSWIDRELHEGVFQDARLLRRLRVLLGQFAQAPGQSIALVCQDWANTKAAYRFLSNARVSEADILAGHFDATRERIAATPEAPVLMLHDTTEFSWQRDSAQAVGVLGKTNSGRDVEGRMRQHTVCGLLMHSSMAITCEGLPLGLAAVKFWSRSKFKGTAALKRSINPTRVPIEEKESICWLDNVRQASAMLGSPSSACTSVTGVATFTSCFVKHATPVRISSFVPARTGSLAMARIQWPRTCDRFAVGGWHRLEVRDSQGHSRSAVLELKYCRVRLLPPRGPSKGAIPRSRSRCCRLPSEKPPAMWSPSTGR